MHSTIQTGLFTPKIYNYGYNNFQRPNASVSHMHQEYPPPPQSYHHHQPQQHYHAAPTSVSQNAKPHNNSSTNMSRSKTDLNSLLKPDTRQTNNSTLGINIASSDLKRNTKTTLSASNIPVFFSSNQNITGEAYIKIQNLT